MGVPMNDRLCQHIELLLSQTPGACSESFQGNAFKYFRGDDVRRRAREVRSADIRMSWRLVVCFFSRWTLFQTFVKVDTSFWVLILARQFFAV